VQGENGQQVITSRRNTRIVEARKLGQLKHRRRQGRFLAEGLQIIHMGLDAGVAPQQVLFCEQMFVSEHAQELMARSAAMGAECLAVSADVMASLSDRKAPQGLLAAFPLLWAASEGLRIGPSDLVVIVDRLQDPGNLGTIIRTADAVGAAAVMLLQPCVDPFDPKTVRASMGSLFNVPIVGVEDVAEALSGLLSRGLRSVGADANLGDAWGGQALRGGVALLLGNEARGLSEDVREHVQAWARLPLIGGAESLNVAVAAGVLMYTWLRENWGI
jgi:TrmH family RNA methyltransferase